jgi:D-sedoheptulose 7-phosphate isomerase
MNISDKIKKTITDSIDTKKGLLQDENLLNKIEEAANACCDAYKTGNKTMFAGNGGSAADAQHLAAEFISKFCFDRPGLPSIALTANTSVLTAIGNDYGFADLFARQVQALGVKGDVFFGISTSGNSENVVNAASVCKEKGVLTIALTGADPCKMDCFDIVIKCPSTETPRIQECQTLIGHIICDIVESAIFGHLKKKQ